MKSERVRWLDAMRGIGMMLVILHHTGLRFFGRFILAFHMPVFFFISGYLYEQREMYKIPFGTYLYKQFKRLFIPWAFWGGVSLIINTVIRPLIAGNFDLLALPRGIGNQLLYMNGYWFIACMFMTSVLFHAVYRLYVKIRKAPIFGGGGVCFLLVLSVLCLGINIAKNKIGLTWYFQLGQTMMAIPFFVMGALSVKPVGKLFSSKGALWKTIVLTCVSAVLMAGFTLLNYKLANGANFIMASDTYGFYCFAMPAAFFGVIMTLGLSGLWTELFGQKSFADRFCMFFSEHSLVIYPVHLFAVDIGKILASNIPINNWILKFLFNLLLVAIFMLLIPLINRYLPFAAGRKRRKKKPLSPQEETEQVKCDASEQEKS